MVTHSNYSTNKAFKALNIKQQFIKKKTKQKRKTTYLGNLNKLKDKNTKKRKYSRKGNVYKGSLKSKRKTPININKNNRQLNVVKLKQQDGAGFFSSCIGVSIDKTKKKYDKLDAKLQKFLVPFSDTMNMMKKSYLKVLKEQYYNELINKRKIFNQEKKRDEIKGDKIKGDTTVFDDQIKDLQGNLQEIKNVIEIKLGESKGKMSAFNKKKKKYDKVSKNYRNFVDKLMYGSKKNSSKIDKKSFSYKINKIIDIKQTAEVASEGSEERKKYKKCQKKYDKAIKIYTDIKARIGENLFKGGTLNNDILFINAFITKSGKQHEDNITEFQSDWETETDKFYDELIKLVPEQTLDSIKTNTSIKSLDYKKEVEKIESQIINIYDIFNQVNESVLQINVVRVLEHVKKFMSGVKDTQGGIVKDLKLLKEEFLNLKGAPVLKSMSNHIVRAHLQNTKLLVCVKYYFDNIESEEAIKLFTTTNISKYSDFNKRVPLSKGLGISTAEQNVFQQPVIRVPASGSGSILNNLGTSSIVGGGDGFMKGGGTADILRKHKQFESNKTALENLIEKTIIRPVDDTKFLLWKIQAAWAAKNKKEKDITLFNETLLEKINKKKEYDDSIRKLELEEAKLEKIIAENANNGAEINKKKKEQSALKSKGTATKGAEKKKIGEEHNKIDTEIKALTAKNGELTKAESNIKAEKKRLEGIKNAYEKAIKVKQDKKKEDDTKINKTCNKHKGDNVKENCNADINCFFNISNTDGGKCNGDTNYIRRLENVITTAESGDRKFISLKDKDKKNTVENIKKKLYDYIISENNKEAQQRIIKAYEEKNQEYLTLKKQYYLKLLFYLTISEKIKSKEGDTTETFKAKKKEAISDFEKSSLYVIYHDIFDSTDYSKDNTIFVKDFIKELKSEDTTKKKFDKIKKEFLNDQKINNEDNDEIEKALEYFKKMLEAD